MSLPNPRRGAGALLLALLLTACAGPAGEPAVAGTPGTSSPAYASILAAFDEADSAASAGGNVEALKGQETSPSLQFSVAAVNRAKITGRSQPAFRHTDPVFAAPHEDLPCFLATASLRLTGEEMSPVDVSHFLKGPDGAWRLSHNVQVSADMAPAARSIAGATAGSGTALLPESQRSALVAELFARTIAAGTGELVAPSRVLDQQLAAGWSIYHQQMSAAGITVARTLTGSEWSACAAPAGGGVLTFLTLYATDRLTADRKGGRVTLPVESPDVTATGHREPVSGEALTVSRLEVFLLLVPPTGAATVLGLLDTATSVEPT
ncbi:hypothetical protein [Actinoplanes sp. HUAS TT8]|uniref:hypothetical protein n=1 Tax=Actinoplanes sp. HUAS TT8 TaxID=3447453 RepID=UPI003F51F618